MFKIKNHTLFQTILVIATILFVLTIYLTQYVINEKIYKFDYFSDVTKVVNEKEFLIKNVYYDGKYLSNSIKDSIDIASMLKNNREIAYDNSILDSFFNSQHTLSNISIYDKDLNLILNKYKNNKNIDLDLEDLIEFKESNKASTLSRMYLKKEAGVVKIPHLPKVSYLNKIFKDGQMLGIIVVEYNLNYRLKNFFNNDKYNLILMDEYGETYYHIKDLKSWSRDLNRTNVSLDYFKEDYNSILTNRIYKTDYLYSNRLDLNIDKGLIVVCELKEEYVDNFNDLRFKRKLLFFLIFGLATVSMLTLALIIIRTSNSGLERFRKISKEYQVLQKFSTQAEEIGRIGLWEVDAYNTLKWNSMMYSILDIENDNARVSYEMFLTYIHPDDKEKFDKEYKYSKNTSTDRYITYRIITNNSRIKWVEQRWKHFYSDDGSFVKTIGSLYDISFNKEVEKNFQNENENLRTYFDTLNLSLVIINNEMEIKYFNKTLLKALGTSKKELSKKSSFLSLISEDNEMFRYILIELLEKKEIGSKEIRLIKNNGEIATFKAEFKLILSNDEILISLEDISNEIKNQDNFLINQSRLADLGEMLIDLTYQWRQPLTLISTSASFLKLEHEINSQQREETIDVLSKIIQSSTNLSNTIDDFKYYVEDDTSESKFLVNMSIEKVLQLLSNSIIENDIEIIKDFDEDVELKNVENSFMQVLVNIMKNAIDALKENQKSKRFIFISTEISKDKLNITITDNAYGIEEQVLPSIFDEFFTTKSDKKSTGLGLFLAKKIVNSKLKGSLKASNREYNYKDDEYKGASLKISLSILNKED